MTNCRNAYSYAVVRIVPFVQREEFFNAGVIVFCPERKYLDARIHLDHQKLNAFAPQLDADEVQRRLDAVPKICAGDHSEGGPIAHLSQRARFHWLTAPRSTLIQVSPSHSGICEDPASALDQLFHEQVLSIPAPVG